MRNDALSGIVPIYPGPHESARSPSARYGGLEGAFGASLPARFARYGELESAFGASLPARFARYGGSVLLA